jgi:crossover junction endodeoxyribonuclease RuvC
MTSLRIIGIDPGSITTGWGVIEANGSKLVALGYGTAAAKASFNRHRRLMRIGLRIEEVLHEFSPQVFAIEESFYSDNVKTVLTLGETRGVLIYTATKRGMPIYEYAPKKIKQVVGLDGRAEKMMIARLVCSMLKLKPNGMDFNATDALACAVCHWKEARLCPTKKETAQQSTMGARSS